VRPKDWQQVENFAPEEWQQDPYQVPKELVLPVDNLRDTSGIPIFIIEAFATSGHADYSYHYMSLAVDLYFKPGVLTPLQQYLYISLFPEFRGIGFYPNGNNACSWHLDIRNDIPKSLWTKAGGGYFYSYMDFLEALCQKDG